MRHNHSNALFQLNKADIRGVVHEAKSGVLERIEEFTNEGSGWIVKRVLTLDLSTVKYQPFRALSHFPTPRYVPPRTVNDVQKQS